MQLNAYPWICGIKFCWITMLWKEECYKWKLTLRSLHVVSHILSFWQNSTFNDHLHAKLTSYPQGLTALGTLPFVLILGLIWNTKSMLKSICMLNVLLKLTSLNLLRAGTRDTSFLFLLYQLTSKCEIRWICMEVCGIYVIYGFMHF